MSSSSVANPAAYSPFATYSPSQEKANLARIRDNQRRSRARRKEYLQELEARLRQCELHGIEASAEIQMAARKVADENRKLRELLSLQGIGEDGVLAYLQSSPAGDAPMGSQPTSRSAPVQALQQMLQTRRPCCSDAHTGLPVNGGQSESRESSLTSISTSNSPWDLNPPATSGALHHTGKATPHQFMTPSSTTRSTVSSISHHSHHSVPHHQRLAATPLSRNPSPTSVVNTSQMFELDPQLSQSNTYISHQSMPQYLQPHGAPEGIYIPTDTNNSSCVFAANMITTMAGGDPNSVSADLGCLPGMDCDVDNQLVFNIMDRYSETRADL